MARILLVDDQPDVREVLGKLLEMHGHRVETAESAETALDSLRHGTPDVLVVDQHLPGISGMEMLRQLRTGRQTAGLKVVLCSADDSERDAAMADGAFAFWVKGSASIFECVERLDEQLKGNRQADAVL